MVKLNVDEEKCIGCGACVAIDPEHFDFNDNGLSSVIKNDNLESANLKNAQESCPTGAISIGDEIVTDQKCSCCENCTSDENCECGCDNCECGK
ncbi:MAG: ferredoxin [Bacilli bacterium]|nr:ferredoxin [Bacilli bacterium]